MPTIEIYFFGLISHIGGVAAKDHAALLFDPAKDHAARIVWLEGEELREHALDSDPARPVRIHFAIDAKPSDQPAKVNGGDDFDRMVPHLKALTDKDVKSNVKSKSNADDVIAFVDYPGGELRVHDCYDEAGRYTLDDKVIDLDAVARTTVIVVDTGTEPLRVFVDNKAIALIKVNGCLLIENSAKMMLPGVGAKHHHMTGHFQKNKILLEPDSRLATAEPNGKRRRSPDTPPGCSWIDDYLYKKERSFTSIDIECSNTQYP